MPRPEPRRDESGVPWCTEDACGAYDGKRCQLTGFSPSTICEPAVLELVAELVTLRAKGKVNG